MRRQFSFLLFVWALIGMVNAQDKSPAPIDVANLTSGKTTLNVGHVIFPPFYFSDDPNTAGLDADIFRAVAIKAGFKNPNFVLFDSLPQLMAAFVEGKIDIIANGIIESPQRSKNFLLTIPYYIRGGLGGLYVAGKGNFKTSRDLKGYQIGVLNGSSPQHEWLPDQGITPNWIKAYDNVNELVNALKAGQIDVIISNYTFCRYQQDVTNRQLEAFFIQSIPIVYLLRKQDKALQEKLNEAIDSLWKDGTLYSIKRKYLEPLDIEPSHSYDKAKK